MSEPPVVEVGEWVMASLREGRSVHVRGEGDEPLGSELIVTCKGERKEAVVLGRHKVSSRMGEAWELRVRLKLEGE